MQEKVNIALRKINNVILGKEQQVKIIAATWLTGGHVLLEDTPGTGKTVLAKCFSKVFSCHYGRIQFTPDLLPSDITGLTIYDPESKKFNFKKGPIFSTFLLADEINRATPRTQSALLEAMAENQITIDNHLTNLSENFFVIATQNPIESHGTFPLPEAQLDRFTVKLSLGLLSPDREFQMIKTQLNQNILANLSALVSQSEISDTKKIIQKIKIDDSIIQYIINIAEQTRKDENIKFGVSPRATLAYTKLARAYAYLSGRDYVIPTDIYELAVPVLSHRIILTEDAIFDGIDSKTIIKYILQKVKPPKL